MEGNSIVLSIFHSPQCPAHRVRLPLGTSDGSTAGERRRNLRCKSETSIELFGNKTDTTRHGGWFRLCTYNARTLSTAHELYVLLDEATRIKYDVNALQETKNRSSITHKRKDGTFAILGEKVPNRNVGGVGFVVHPSVSQPGAKWKR